MSEQEHHLYIDYYLDVTKIIANSDYTLVNTNSYLNIIQRAFLGFQIFFYITMFGFLIQRFRKKILNSYSNIYLRDLLWIKYYRCLILLPAIFLLLMNSFGKQPYIDNQYAMLIPSTFFVFVLFFWGLVGNHQTQVIVDIEKDDKKGEYLLNKTKNIDIEAIMQKIELLMNRDELFLDNDFKLLDLCVLLDISKEDLRKILKSEYRMNFYTFINTFRVKKAKSLIEEKQYNSVQDLLDKSGFMYLREFITIYKKIEKRSPYII